MTTLSTEPDTKPVEQECSTCTAYFEARLDALALPIVFLALVHGIDPPVLALRYMAAIHRRHLTGGSLEVAA